MGKFTKERFYTLGIYYRVIFIASAIFSLLIFMISPTRDPLLTVIVNFSLPGFLFGLFFYHRFYRSTYTFFRNQGLPVRRVILYSWFFNLSLSLFVIFIRSFYV